MSMHEVRLPSPPPDTYPRGSMSRLFNRAAHNRNQTEIFSDATVSDVESAVRKKVGFHPWTTNILEPQLSTPDSEIAPSLKSLPPSRDCQISARPILKATYSTESAIRSSGCQEKKSHVDQMESLLENLDIGDRSASTDAYQAMISLIRNYEEPSASEILQAKITRLQSYIKRDLVVLDNNPESHSNEERLGLGNLVTSALKVLMTMVWSPVYSPCLTDEFCIWAIDRAIAVLKEHAVAKANLLQYIHVIAVQNFRPSLFTHNSGSRTIRILEALQDLTDHVSGKAVVAERLLVYEKLMVQAKQIMERKVELWMKNMLIAMSHSFKEVRKNALSTGVKACNVFEDSSVVAIAARQALAEETGERSLSASITNKLEKLVAAKEDVSQIPQLWTVVLLLCNNSRVKLETWSQVQFHEWLKLIQRCFNSSDSAIHVQALMAWNRLYYIARPHEASDKIVAMLAKPALKKLDMVGPAQSSKGTRQAVISSYCMLLYYAFRPSLTHAQITHMWNEFIVKTMTNSFLSRNSANCDLGCRVLSALFHNALPASRIWNEKRAQENAYLDPLELPAIDNKWVRSHTSSIISILKLVLTHSSFGPDGNISDQAYAAYCWRNFVKAIRESSSKEIVSSAETKAAQQQIVDLLSTSPSATDEWQISSSKLALLSNITVQEFTIPSLLQALETTRPIHTTAIFHELVKAVAQSIERKENLELNQKALQRCMKILQHSLARMIQENSSNLEHGVQSACEVLRMIPESEALRTLEEMQIVLLDAMQALSCGMDDQQPLSETSSYAVLANSTLGLLTLIKISHYKFLDQLLSALLGSKFPSIKQKTIALQSLKVWKSNKSNLGTILADIVSKFPSNSSSPTESASSSSKVKPKPRGTFLDRLRQSGSERKPRHDDSQVDFVSIDSSPPQSIQFESQFLTARQKEVKARQNTEPAITFADIRSSPSNASRKLRSGRKNVTPRSPELPNTPPLPQQNEDESQTPTPTPKTRKTLQNVLQPEVPSSPASVIGPDGHGSAFAPITSSPIKEVVMSDDAIQLSTAYEDEVAESIEQDIATSALPERVEKPDYFGKVHAGEMSVPAQLMELDVPLTNENYETAPAVASSSPISYSDEDDALAASQLSQNLLQESRSVSVQSEMVDRETSAQKKRKRSREDASQRSKKRKVPQEQEQEEPEVNVTEENHDLDAELSDCIVVDTSFSRALNWRSSRTAKKSKTRTKAKNTTDSPASSQTSQRSSIGTPTSQKSTGTRRRRSRGTGRLTRSQAAQLEDNADTQISTSEQQDIEEAQYENNDTSLPSEIKETPLEVSAEKHVSEPPLPVDEVVQDTPSAIEEAVPGQDDVVDDVMEDPIGLQVAQTAGTPEARPSAVDQSFKPVQSLQSILDAMNAQESGEEFDLAAIHSLCFKIGLRAQQMATKE